MIVRVLLADDDALIRAGLAVVLGSAPDLKVVAEAADGIEAVDLCLRHTPDVVLMDVRMPGIEESRRPGDWWPADRTSRS
jgi:DNA-binding NarL/FixJ family response regulator